MNIGYKLVKNNMPATAEKAPYLGMAIPVGSLAYDNILREMIDGGTKMSLATARYFLEAFYDYAARKIAADAVRINTGTVAIYPMIDGSFDSEDADFDPERNSLYIGATLSQSLRDRIAGIVPDATGDETKGTVKMDRIYDIESQTRGVISGTNPFRISGRNLTVPDAEDESLALYAKDGITKVTDIVVSETDGGQLITCQLSAAVGVPKGTYKVRIASHGLDPTDPLTVATLTVTLVEAVPAPVVPSGDVTASMDSSGGQVVIEGEIGRWVNENCREGGAYDFADRFFFEREDGSREPTAFPFELASKSEDDVAKVDVSVRSGSDVLNKTFRAVLLVKDSAGNDARVTDTFTITF